MGKIGAKSLDFIVGGSGEQTLTVEACPLLGNAVEPQIVACDKGILLVADVFLALAAPELVQQFVVSRYDLSRRLREVSFQSCHPRKEPLPRR